MMISKVRGSFDEFTGNIAFDPNNPEKTDVHVTIQTNSINTRSEDRDNHLRSADFFNVEQFPTMTFVGTRVIKETRTSGQLIGDLTIAGETREVALNVEYLGMAKSPWGTTSAGFNASTTINRKDWGLSWNVALETGGWLVGEKINIDIELELVKQPEAEAVAAD
jgi:polyisoprenoid-binding protein YceI